MKRPKAEDASSYDHAIRFETKQFSKHYNWLRNHMPDGFFDEINPDQLTLITHYLMGFPLQDYFCQIQLKDRAFVLILDSPNVDLLILKPFHLFAIRNYQTFASNEPPPFPNLKKRLRIAVIHLSSYEEKKKEKNFDTLISSEDQEEIFSRLKQTDPEITFPEFRDLVLEMDNHFFRSLNKERLIYALSMFLRATKRDHCQYEIRFNENWDENEKKIPSVQIVFAWRNAPKHRFLFRLSKTIFRHHLKMMYCSASYIQPYGKNSILIMSLGLHGIQGKAAWKEANIKDFLRELVTLKYFPDGDLVEKNFIDSNLVSGNEGNLIRTMISFVHQTLVNGDPNQYSYSSVEEGLCRHVELTTQIIKLFQLKFDPENQNLESYKKEKENIFIHIDHLDTGNDLNDIRHKNILKQAIYFIEYTLKTNFFRNNKSAFCFRLDPNYLDLVPYDRKSKFPELPYAIIFVQGMYFIGFHIRFKDLARGGLRTVFPQRFEQMLSERNFVFYECYNLAYTQQKKNKDIPEGGAKAVIFLEPYERLLSEAEIYAKELKKENRPAQEIHQILKQFKKEQKLQYLYQTQRAFVSNLLSIINCDEKGNLRAKNVIDYWKNPEYIYLGPDENMHNEMIEWIANCSKQRFYKPGIAFISSKPTYGINHKQYGVTSFGVNVYMETVLKYLRIDSQKDPFTIKISGGPDGDVAGNQILNLHRFFPNTAKLLAITDISGTIFDPEGLNLSVLVQLFYEVKPIASYPPKELHNGGFLLDLQTKKKESTYTTKTLCWSKEEGKLLEKYLSGNEMNYLFRHNLHQVKTDIFIPAGGRPRTLHEKNYTDFLDEEGVPTSRAIIEGANLYLTSGARKTLESLGVLIIKDSSANKGGVICSSMEILAGLILTEEEFLNEKETLMKQILSIIRQKSLYEGELLLKTHLKTKKYLSDISDEISKRINAYTDELLDFFETTPLPTQPNDPLVKAFLSICPPLLATKYRDRVIENLPSGHKKAMVACFLASQLVYKKGLSWSPSVVDILPLIATDLNINASSLKDHEIHPL